MGKKKIIERIFLVIRWLRELDELKASINELLNPSEITLRIYREVECATDILLSDKPKIYIA